MSNINREEVQNIVFDIVSEICQTSVDQISVNSSVGDFPSWDSLGQLNILQNIQDRFDIELEPEDMLEIEDVNDMINAVLKKTMS